MGKGTYQDKREIYENLGNNVRVMHGDIILNLVNWPLQLSGYSVRFTSQGLWA